MGASPYAPLERPAWEPDWWPADPAQQAYLNSKAELLMGGGQSGGGKSQVLAADAVQEYQNPRLRGLLLRTTLEEMAELEDIQQKMYEPLGARWTRRRSIAAWRFPSGATIRPGYLAHDKHLKRYQGNPYSWLGVDESGQHPENRIRFMLGWLAAPIGSGLRVRARFTSNPGGDGHGWQMKVFLRNRCPVHFPADYADDKSLETSVYPGAVYRGACWTDDSPVYKTTAFIPFRLIDNPFYDENKRKSLLTQTKALQQQLLYGCWCMAEGLYFDCIRPNDVVPYATIGDSWWWQHFISIDYGFGNSYAAGGMYAINPNGIVFKVRERVEPKMDARKFALAICKKGFGACDYPKQTAQDNWLKKLKARDPEKPRISFCVMDEAMDQHRGTGESVYDMIEKVMTEHGISSMKAAHDPMGNAQVLYNGLANKLLVLTRESSDLPLTYRSLSTRVIDKRKAVKKVHGSWEDDIYDECLKRGTMIATESGNHPIENILPGELVWTRRGLKPVLWAGRTGRNAMLTTAHFSDGTTLSGTANHPVFITGRGFVRLDSISYGDKIVSWSSNGLRLSSIAASHSGATQTRNNGPIETTSAQVEQTDSRASMTCIEKSEEIISAQSPMAMLSTTRTPTHRTTSRQTLNSKPKEITRSDVYNLSVADAEEFFANGILVHNCSYAYNTWRENSEKPARTALAEELAQMKKDGMDDTSLARIAWQREQNILAEEKQKTKGIRLTKSLESPGRK